MKFRRCEELTISQFPRGGRACRCRSGPRRLRAARERAAGCAAALLAAITTRWAPRAVRRRPEWAWVYLRDGSSMSARCRCLLTHPVDVSVRATVGPVDQAKPWLARRSRPGSDCLAHRPGLVRSIRSPRPSRVRGGRVGGTTESRGCSAGRPRLRARPLSTRPSLPGAYATGGGPVPATAE
jgi:hypothetical protein